jgi:hypothetical protein
MTPEQEKELRWKYADNLLELMALQPELFEDRTGLPPRPSEEPDGAQQGRYHG